MRSEDRYLIDKLHIVIWKLSRL